MQAADPGQADDGGGRVQAALHRTAARGVLAEAKVRAVLMVEVEEAVEVGLDLVGRRVPGVRPASSSSVRFIRSTKPLVRGERTRVVRSWRSSDGMHGCRSSCPQNSWPLPVRMASNGTPG